MASTPARPTTRQSQQALSIIAHVEGQVTYGRMRPVVADLTVLFDQGSTQTRSKLRALRRKTDRERAEEHYKKKEFAKQQMMMVRPSRGTEATTEGQTQSCQPEPQHKPRPATVPVPLPSSILLPPLFVPRPK